MKWRVIGSWLEPLIPGLGDFAPPPGRPVDSSAALFFVNAPNPCFFAMSVCFVVKCEVALARRFPCSFRRPLVALMAPHKTHW